MPGCAIGNGPAVLGKKILRQANIQEKKRFKI